MEPRQVDWEEEARGPHVSDSGMRNSPCVLHDAMNPGPCHILLFYLLVLITSNQKSKKQADEKEKKKETWKTRRSSRP